VETKGLLGVGGGGDASPYGAMGLTPRSYRWFKHGALGGVSISPTSTKHCCISMIQRWWILTRNTWGR